MIDIPGKRLLPDDIEQIKHLRRRYMVKLGRSALFCAISLGLFALSYHNITFYKQNITNRKAISIPVDNTLLSRGPTISQEIFAWVHRFYPHMGGTTWLDPYLGWLLLGVISAYLALFPLCAFLVDIFGIHAIPRVFKSWNAFFLGCSFLISEIISLLIFLLEKQFHILHLSIMDALVGYMFCVTVITFFLSWLMRHFLPVPLFRQIPRQLLVGILLALYLYFTLGQLTPHPWNTFSFTKAELMHSGVLFFLLWPVCLLHEATVRNWREYRTTNKVIAMWMLSQAFRLLFLLALSICIYFLPGTRLLGFLWPAMLVPFLFLETCGSQLYKHGRATIAATTSCALIMSYILSTFFLS
jgi:hypothetical protein